jgi:RNA polymerase sigma-70 factor, ECF subfamily
MPVQAASSPMSEADRAWFADQIDALLPELYGSALRLCRHRENAEDLAADTVAKGWAALPSLEGETVIQLTSVAAR